MQIHSNTPLVLSRNLSTQKNQAQCVYDMIHMSRMEECLLALQTMLMMTSNHYRSMVKRQVVICHHVVPCVVSYMCDGY